jgi:hypothetical protein
MKEIADLLFKLQLPSWIVLLVFIAGAVIVSIYKYKLDGQSIN